MPPKDKGLDEEITIIIEGSVKNFTMFNKNFQLSKQKFLIEDKWARKENGAPNPKSKIQTQMTPAPTKKQQSIQYSSRTTGRAERALCCSPFQLALFVAMRTGSVPLQVIAGKAGIQQGYTQIPLSERRAEKELIWLINVGLLRREVDGQGITDSFRLTPLGRQLLEKWELQGGSLPTPSWLERIYNVLNRWLRLPL